jgi:uncharacterized repeat protein (TIGR01451 family)
MHGSIRRRGFSALIIPPLILGFLVTVVANSTAAPAAHTPQLIEGKPSAILRYDPTVSNLRVPPPRAFSDMRPQTRSLSPTISVNFIAPGSRDASGTDCYAWPEAAKNALNYAILVWSSLIESSVPVAIDACWADLGGSILGYGGANSYVLEGGTLYPVALANALSGSDLNGPKVEINVTYNRDFDWYWGTDGNTPSHQIDFVSVVMHEVCHGLGFGGSMAIYSGLGYWGFGMVGQPAVYDRFTENGSGQALLGFPNGSAALASQLTSDDLYFDGPGARAANGGAPPKLFAPSFWMAGSSYAHLDEAFDGTPNALMTYSLSRGASLHSPGPVALGILKDTGWRIVDEPPDLNLSLTLENGTDLKPGDPFSYTISIANIGTGPASGITISNVLPTEVMTPTWTASASLAGLFLQHGPPYVWSLEGLDTAASGVITVSGNVDPMLPAGFGIINTASIIASEPETRTDNNSAALVIGGTRAYLPFVIKP